MGTKEESMQAICEEMWVVDAGKDTFELNPEQVEVLKQASVSNSRGLVWFKEFAISIPHVMSVRLKSKKYFKQLIGGGPKLAIGKQEYDELIGSSIAKN